LLNNQLFRALLLLVSVLTACQGTTGGGNTEVNMQSNSPPTNTPSSPTAEAKTPPPATGNAVRVARWSRDPKEGSLLATLTAPIAIVNNCLVVKYNDTSPPTVLIFPYDSGVWNDAKRTFTYQGKVIRIGEPITVGGGYIQNLDKLKPDGKYDVPDCGINSFFQVF
jgi:hypothetical protein